MTVDINWQTGTPPRKGEYLITCRYVYETDLSYDKNGKVISKDHVARIVRTAFWDGEFWNNYDSSDECRITAWSNLSDIDPYIED